MIITVLCGTGTAVKTNEILHKLCKLKYSNFY